MHLSQIVSLISAFFFVVEASKSLKPPSFFKAFQRLTAAGLLSAQLVSSAVADAIPAIGTPAPDFTLPSNGMCSALLTSYQFGADPPF